MLQLKHKFSDLQVLQPFLHFIQSNLLVLLS